MRAAPIVGRLALAQLLLLSLVDCTNDPPPVSNAPNAPDVTYNTATEQGETDIVTAMTFLLPNLTTAFNDFSVNTTGDPMFQWLPSMNDPQQRQTRRGASLMG